MVADFMTKPLQGSLFKKFRDLIMGLLSMDEAAKVLTQDTIKCLAQGYPAPQECVG
jgi:hypothetical protein